MSDENKVKKHLPVLLLPLIFFIAMVILLFAGLSGDPSKLDSLLVGKKLPEFEKSVLLDVEKIVTSKDIQGPAIINVFASWCSPCYQEHPNLMKLAAAKEVTIYGVNYKDLRPDALTFINNLGNPYEFIIFDDNGRLGIDLGVYGAPETFLINSDNEIIYRHVGIINDDVWKLKLKPKLFPENSNSAVRK
jgi:cytochrome c biogenesis protein CcmG/thiol:disulfide interchange protein DsbE